MVAQKKHVAASEGWEANHDPGQSLRKGLVPSPLPMEGGKGGGEVFDDERFHADFCGYNCNG